MPTTTSIGNEELLRTASQHAEDWFPAVLKISNSIPLGEEDWDRATNLLTILQKEFRIYAEILRGHSDELSTAAATANTGVFQFSVLNGKQWRCAHLALLDGIESFLRSTLHLFQPLAEYETQVDLSRSISASDIQGAKSRFSWTVRNWVSQYDPENWGNVLRELIVAERSNLQTNTDCWSDYFPVVEWQPVWNPKREISFVKTEIRKLQEQNLAKRRNGKPNGYVSIRMQTLQESRISPPRSAFIPAK